MILSINQPAYLPAMRYFQRIQASDLHVVLDHVRLEKGGFTNRTRIRQRDGRLAWLTIPVEKGQPINQTLIADQKWKWKHRRALAQHYPDSLGKIGIFGYPKLIGVLNTTTRELAALLGLNSDEWLRSSDLGGERLGVKSELVLNLCKKLGADVYLSGPYGRNYLDLPTFDKAGIEVRFQEMPAEYPVLSAVDDLFGAVRAA